jgi:hypothetical protein
MPYIIRKIRNQPYYSVKNAETGTVHSQHTTRKNAMAQVRLLQNIGGMKKQTPFAPRHALFQGIRPPVPAPLPVFAPPRPPTPDYGPVRYQGRDEVERQLDALAPSLSGLLSAPARARAPAAAASSSSSTSSSSASSFPLTPTNRSFLDRADLDRIQANIRDGLTMTPVLVPIYSTLKKIKNENERARYATALYNLGYTKASIKEMIRTGQFLQLMRHIQSNFDTLIPARRGGAKGIRGKNLRGMLFGMPITDSGARVPAPKMKMDLKEFHAKEGVNRPGHPRYNVFPQYVAKAKKAFKGTEDAHEDALFRQDMAKLKRKTNKWTGGPSPYGDTSTVPLAEMMRRSATIGRERSDTFEV